MDDLLDALGEIASEMFGSVTQHLDIGFVDKPASPGLDRRPRFASAASGAYLTRSGGHCIHAEKFRHTNAEAGRGAGPGRALSHVTATLRVKEVWVGGNPPGDGVRAQRFVICHNPEQAQRDAAVRGRLIAHLGELIDGSDTWSITPRAPRRPPRRRVAAAPPT